MRSIVLSTFSSLVLARVPLFVHFHFSLIFYFDVIWGKFSIRLFVPFIYFCVVFLTKSDVLF